MAKPEKPPTPPAIMTLVVAFDPIDLDDAKSLVEVARGFGEVQSALVLIQAETVIALV